MKQLFQEYRKLNLSTQMIGLMYLILLEEPINPSGELLDRVCLGLHHVVKVEANTTHVNTTISKVCLSHVIVMGVVE